MKRSVIESDNAASSSITVLVRYQFYRFLLFLILIFLSLYDFAFYLLFNFLLFYGSVMIIIEFAVITLMNIFIIFMIPGFLIRYSFYSSLSHCYLLDNAPVQPRSAVARARSAENRN